MALLIQISSPDTERIDHFRQSLSIIIQVNSTNTELCSFEAELDSSNTD
jgi:hypothetical protein